MRLVLFGPNFKQSELCTRYRCSTPYSCILSLLLIKFPIREENELILSAGRTNSAIEPHETSILTRKT
jgi:hypothetical protein